MKSNKKLFFLLLILILNCVNKQAIVLPEVINGKINLSKFNFYQQTLPLAGDWFFEWNELSEPGSLISKNSNKVIVPSHWMDYRDSEGNLIPMEGRATFEVELNIPKPEYDLALRIPSMDTAFTLFWNGEEIARNSNLDRNFSEVVPQYYAPIIRDILIKPGSNILTLHMINSQYPRPGFRDPIIIGFASDLKLQNERNLFIDVFLSGSLFLMSIYHIGIFLLKPKDKSTLYFALFAFFISIRLSVTGEAFSFRFFPINWNFSTFLEYISFYLSPPIMLLYIRKLYPEDGSRLWDRITIIPALIFVILVLVLPIGLYTKTLMYFQIYSIIVIIYFFYILINAIKNKRETAIAFLLGTIVFFGTYANDALYANRMIDSIFITPIGMFFFFFAQAFLLSKRFATAFDTAETLTKELDEKVKQRTNDLLLERDRADNLLKNILPDEVATELKERGSVRPMYFPSVTVMFIDFVNFTEISQTMNPNDLVNELDYCFRAFDDIVERNGLEKLKTIGDSYMCASGIPLSNPNHAIICCEAALEIKSWMDAYSKRKEREGKRIWSYRIGIHSGAVTAGVIGSKKFAYDIWGDTVNVASRMESHADPSTINISEETYRLIQGRAECSSRGKIEVKGKGELTMYQLVKL
ncbi:adenylate/guanylate cyclase domain-containing protein [Leptospira sp. GIMC2001]|uniref:adenylate/guanylate cyclase domain-containing protein n=1 Tax=Leptospira sp. GIMC2001 TaxID=1513297 RepID=UPI002349B47F|nr:adenylate/guanylate cyclase domain-containing protein [Leptospira sp. GIMC2001]WCL50121.1 adenylate/guanylate cyclase domain-containing protein [Leptospira sp. GIMC2001]